MREAVFLAKAHAARLEARGRLGSRLIVGFVVQDEGLRECNSMVGCSALATGRCCWYECTRVSQAHVGHAACLRPTVCTHVVIPTIPACRLCAEDNRLLC